jgi:hypothetical protein
VVLKRNIHFHSHNSFVLRKIYRNKTIFLWAFPSKKTHSII